MIAAPESRVNAPAESISTVPSAVIWMFAAAAAASTVTILNVPLVPAVNTAVSLDDPVIVTTLPFRLISSTVNAVRVPKLVIAVWAAWVTVNAVPDALPVKLPVIAPVVVIVSMYAFLKYNELVPKSTSLSAVGLSTPSANITWLTALLLTPT